MPQLEFSVWLTNLAFNWSVLAFLLALINSKANSICPSAAGNSSLAVSVPSGQWPWT